MRTSNNLLSLEYAELKNLKIFLSKTLLVLEINLIVRVHDAGYSDLFQVILTLIILVSENKASEWLLGLENSYRDFLYFKQRETDQQTCREFNYSIGFQALPEVFLWKTERTKIQHYR